MTDWTGANCLDIDPEVMQPEVATPEAVAVAQRVCGGCPMFWQCRELAASQPGAYGVHAGTWWGEDPRLPGATECVVCGGPVEGERATRLYCSGRCREAARRERNRERESA